MWEDFIEKWENSRSKKENALCDYCYEIHPARDCVSQDGTERFLMSYDDGTLLGKPFVYERKINFCPMCGKKLNSED
jgi:hypothetical protein